MSGTLITAHGRDVILDRHQPELLAAAARVAFSHEEATRVEQHHVSDDGAAAYLPRAAALRFLAAICGAAAARDVREQLATEAAAVSASAVDERASTEDGNGPPGPVSSLWDSLLRLRVPQQLPALLSEASLSAGALQGACALMHALLPMRPSHAAALFTERGHLGALLRWLDVRQHWLAFLHAQPPVCAPAAGPAAAATALLEVEPGSSGAVTASPLSQLQGEEWLSRALPRVQLARAAVIRLLRALLATSKDRWAPHCNQCCPSHPISLSDSPTTIAPRTTLHPQRGSLDRLLDTAAHLLPHMLPILADSLATPSELSLSAAAEGAMTALGSADALHTVTAPVVLPPGQWGALVSLLQMPANAYARAVVQTCELETRYEALQLWRQLLALAPATRVYLLGASV